MSPLNKFLYEKCNKRLPWVGEYTSQKQKKKHVPKMGLAHLGPAQSGTFLWGGTPPPMGGYLRVFSVCGGEVPHDAAYMGCRRPQKVSLLGTAAELSKAGARTD